MENNPENASVSSSVPRMVDHFPAESNRPGQPHGESIEHDKPDVSGYGEHGDNDMREHLLENGSKRDMYDVFPDHRNEPHLNQGQPPINNTNHGTEADPSQRGSSPQRNHEF